jgi:hypothetical protein
MKTQSKGRFVAAAHHLLTEPPGAAERKPYFAVLFFWWKLLCQDRLGQMQKESSPKTTGVRGLCDRSGAWI